MMGGRSAEIREKKVGAVRYTSVVGGIHRIRERMGLPQEGFTG